MVYWGVVGGGVRVGGDSNSVGGGGADGGAGVGGDCSAAAVEKDEGS